MAKTDEDLIMSMTKHMQERMSERAISSTMIQLVEVFGINSRQGDKVILNRNAANLVIKKLRNYLKELEKIQSRGGITLVEYDGIQITTYFNDSYKRLSGGN